MATGSIYQDDYESFAYLNADFSYWDIRYSNGTLHFTYVKYLRTLFCFL